MKRKRKTDQFDQQIGIYDIKLRIGDKLYKNGILYGEIIDESDTLFFISKPHQNGIIPSPYIKEKLIDNLLLGIYSIDKINYE